MLNKNNQKIEFMEIHACSSRFSSLFMLFVNVVAQKSERNHLNITGMKNFKSLEFDREIKCWKDFKEEYNLEMNFQELQQTKTTN
jgi:hypothetical protein